MTPPRSPLLPSEAPLVDAIVEALESAHVGFVITIDGGEVPLMLYVNGAAVRILGRSREEVATRSVFEYIAPEDLPRVIEMRERRLRDEPIETSLVLTIVRGDGERRLLDIGLHPVELDGRRASVIFFTDVTERRRLQEQLIQTEQLAAVGTLATGIAHEINNPLTYVLLNLAFVDRELPKVREGDGRMDDVVRRLDEAREGAERVAHIVRGLRTFARPAEEEVEPVDVARALSSAVKMAANELRHRARLTLAIEPVPPVLANEARLGQVFLNLLVNAAQAIPEGRAQENEVGVTVACDGGRVVVEVRDTGQGIPEALQERIFEPFFTTKPRGVGTGLGLSICRRIVSTFGGDIGVASRPGAGSTFRVELPTTARAAAGTRPGLAAGSSVPIAAPAVRPRLLIVDDEPGVAASLGRDLASDHDVTIASTGREALERLLGGEFDRVLCDLLMPEMTGMDLHAEVARRRPGLEARMVFMTGGPFTPRAERFLTEVANPRLQKPLDGDAVRSLARRISQ
jgi:PAS domain S-box-containing protein